MPETMFAIGRPRSAARSDERMAPQNSKPAAKGIARGPRSDDLAGQQDRFEDSLPLKSFQCLVVARRFGLPATRAAVVADHAFTTEARR